MTLASPVSRMFGAGGVVDHDLMLQLELLGAHCDAERLYPYESLALLTERDFHLRFAPPLSGGHTFLNARSENKALLCVLRQIGRADLALGRIVEGHINALKLYDWFGTEAQQRALGDQLRAGRWFGVWATEPAPTVLLTDPDGGWSLDGSKRFATGAGHVDFALVTVQAPNEERRLVAVPANIPERADLSGWRVRGMRATMSGSYHLSGLRAGAETLIGAPGDYDRDPAFTAGAWRFTAVQLGGIEALLIETRAAMSEAAKADPVQRARFADAVVATRTAYAWVREAAIRAADAVEDAPAFARMTRGVVERSALAVMELAARIAGTRSAFDDQRLDKIIRDLSFYLRQAGPDYARDQAAIAWLEEDAWGAGDRLW